MKAQHARIATLSLSALALVLAVGCGGGPKLAEIAPTEPQAMLPSGARMAVGLHPQLIASNPLAKRLREALQADRADLPIESLARLAGIESELQVDLAVVALYGAGQGGATWGMALAGEFDRDAALKAAQARGAELKPDETFQGMTYSILERGSGEEAQPTFVLFPAPGLALLSDNRGVVQKGIAVWNGKADGLLSDAAFKPRLEGLSTDAAVWLTGWAAGTLDQIQVSAGPFARGDNLGRGVDSYRATLALTAASASLVGTFECQNADSAKKQRENYLELAKSYAQMLFQSGLGMGILGLFQKLQMTVDGRAIATNLELTAQEVEAVSQQFEQARSRPMRIQDLLGGAAGAMPIPPEAPSASRPEAAATPAKETPGAEPRDEGLPTPRSMRPAQTAKSAPKGR
ncbi:MAG: hypothetical protein NTW86_13730 [Candidatus Sumerlaeota bacterium]|nr:hypothetical protein [Candidatus Sumerlaeota bacterium]